MAHLRGHAARSVGRPLGSVGFVEIHPLEGIAGDLIPDAILLDRNLVDLDVVDFELARLLVHPEIDVVIFVLAAGLAEVGAQVGRALWARKERPSYQGLLRQARSSRLNTKKP